MGRRWSSALSSEDQLASFQRCHKHKTYQQGFAIKACGGTNRRASTSHDTWLSVYLRSFAVSVTPSNNSRCRFFNTFEPILQPQHLHVLQSAMPSPSLIHHLWKALGINSSVGRDCGEFIALKGIYGRELLNLLGPSPLQLRKVPVFCFVPDNSQNFE